MMIYELSAFHLSSSDVFPAVASVVVATLAFRFAENAARKVDCRNTRLMEWN
jgi:hypothetical protein